ncbi:MAG: DUF4276 family protein [Candidatus Adiutrix sp.]|jgi:hypothetical protein|nr:DUF4276 family protein [Candidatus Adiutrix sp.]
MHFDFLVEDLSGKKALEVLLAKIIGLGVHTFTIHRYGGLGHLPKGLKPGQDAGTRMLLNQLPKLLQGYGHTHAKYTADYPAVVIVVCDLDKKCLKKFRQELDDLLRQCDPRPNARFCLAIEEGEAWLLGDVSAVKAAYPRAKTGILRQYENDAICGTWERLADAVYPGGSVELSVVPEKFSTNTIV